MSDQEGRDGKPLGPSVVERSRKRIFDDFFKVDEVVLSHRQLDGSMSADKRRLVFERGDAVAALIYNREKNAVVLVEEFKAPTLGKGRGGGWIVETMAGMIRSNETPEQAARREALEETGYRLADVEFIASFFSSPGGSSERIFLFYAVVGDADKVAAGGGVATDGEEIRIVELTPEQLFARLRNHEIEDPKLVIAAYHLAERLKLPQQKATPLQSTTILYEHVRLPGLRIGIKTGDIRGVRGVDVWVNSENTDMLMDRLIGKSISASIRYLGAEKDGGNVVRDTIADDLRRKLRGRGHVRLGTVEETEAGALDEHDVKRILHVASARSYPGRGISTDIETVALAVGKVLEYADKRNRGFLRLRSRFRSILLPLMGTGDGGLTRDQVAPRLIESVCEFFEHNPQTALKDIYVLAYTGADKAVLEMAIEASKDFRRV